MRSCAPPPLKSSVSSIALRAVTIEVEVKGEEELVSKGRVFAAAIELTVYVWLR